MALQIFFGLFLIRFESNIKDAFHVGRRCGCGGLGRKRSGRLIHVESMRSVCTSKECGCWYTRRKLLIDKAALRTALSVSELPLRYHIGRDALRRCRNRNIKSGPRAPCVQFGGKGRWSTKELRWQQQSVHLQSLSPQTAILQQPHLSYYHWRFVGGDTSARLTKACSLLGSGWLNDSDKFPRPLRKTHQT